MKNLISELICTRISHDIIGNIGAVANASELLEEGDMDFLDDIKAILKSSSFNLSSRMKFFRLAFGLDNSNLANAELVKKTVNDYLCSLGGENCNFNLTFDVTDTSLIKPALIMTMIMSDLLYRGGDIRTIQSEEYLYVIINKNDKISADKLALIKQVLAGVTEAVNANTAPLALLIEDFAGGSISLQDDNRSYALQLKWR